MSEAVAPAEIPAEVLAETVAGPQDQARQSRREREKSWRGGRGGEKQDYNSDARAPEERARKTRRNPHGIAEMEHGENVVAFGGFTPAFLLVDPYVSKPGPRDEKLDEDEMPVEDELEKSA